MKSVITGNLLQLSKLIKNIQLDSLCVFRIVANDIDFLYIGYAPSYLYLLSLALCCKAHKADYAFQKYLALFNFKKPEKVEQEDLNFI